MKASNKPQRTMAAEKLYRKGEATRQALMLAGFRAFAQTGFIRAQIVEIARDAGKSTGVFHLYFKNKGDLLDAWLDECDMTVPWHQADISLLFEKAPGFILQSYWSLYAEFGPILDALDAASLVNDHFSQRLAAVQAKNNGSIVRMIRHAQAEGRYTSIDPELTAISIGALVTKTTSYWFRNRQALEARGFDEAAAMANLKTLYTRMLGGEGVITASARQMPKAAARKRTTKVTAT